MNLRPRRRAEPNIDLTPLIDVVFLLVIFFMVSTSFRQESDIEIELPQASQPAGPAQPQRLEISIDARGRFFINDQPITGNDVDALKTRLRTLAKGNRDLPFIIRADGQTPHRAVVTAMDAARQLGFRRLAIATQPAPKPAPGAP
jgi:biopolymer transport protein ExbD